MWRCFFFIFLLLFFSSLQEPEGHVEVRVRHADWKLNAVCAASVAGKHSCCYHGYCHLRWCHIEVLILFWRKQLIISVSIFFVPSSSFICERDQTIQQRRKLPTSRGNMRRRRIYMEAFMDIYKRKCELDCFYTLTPFKSIHVNMILLWADVKQSESQF